MPMLAPYSEKRLLGNDSAGDTFTAGTVNGAAFTGFGSYPHLAAKLTVGGVSGGSDAFDCKIQYYINDGWVDLITFTQATGATSELKIFQRKSDVTWTDKMRVVTVTATGATATGVKLTLVGAQNGV